MLADDLEKTPLKKSETKLADYERLRTIRLCPFSREMHVKGSYSGTYFALKIWSKARVKELGQIRQTLDEKRILLKVDFLFIVKMEKCFQTLNKLFMITEFVPGGEMFNYLRRVGRFEEKQAKFYASQIVLSFEYLHSKHILYRNLKPENILIDDRGYIKLTDFGFAKETKERTFTLCGTPEYLAPEVVVGTGQTKAVDWWTLGILIYEMISGYAPFFADDPMHVYKKILDGKITFSKHFSNDSVNITNSLLASTAAKRLGSRPSGAMDVKTHQWFSDIDWTMILQKTVEAPFLPTVTGPGDSTNYDTFDEEAEKEEENSDDEFAEF